MLEQYPQKLEVWTSEILEKKKFLTQDDKEKNEATIKSEFLKLKMLAKQSKQTTSFNLLEETEILEARKTATELQSIDNTIEHMLKRWRHYNPKGKIKMSEITQRGLEKELKKKWLLRLITHFLPFAREIPHMAEVAEDCDPLNEYLDLFGKTRWRTAKIYTLNLEKIRRHYPNFIPWDTKSIRVWLNEIGDPDNEWQMTPSKLESLWGTLKPLSAILGLLDPEDVDTLKKKLEATMDKLVKTVVKAKHRAMVMPLQLVETLERIAVGNANAVVRFHAGMARFAIGCSARMSDLQHTSPKTMRITSTTLEYEGWQTKTVNVHETNRKPIPLVAPKMTLSFGPHVGTIPAETGGLDF